ncbi:MAG: protein adenylyltransferase SelO [Alphaproteobacteria bacterium]
MKRLEDLNFNNSFRSLPNEFYTPVQPACFESASLISYNPAAFALLDLDTNEATRKEFVEYFSGQKQLSGFDPLAIAYAGHQFGHYVAQLGDGRAILLGEVINDKKEKWDLHAKGAGQTAYSRGFDGRAVLRSSIREYLASEAMHGLGIPTTRALCLIGTGEKVIREGPEKGALIIRMAPSHIRFGNFEYFYYNKQYKELQILADYSIKTHYSHLVNKENKYKLFFQEIVKRTAKLIAKWMAVGFTHGVLNTDNMSIMGLTIDYGPYGFMDSFNFDFVPNHSDYSGRYSYRNQPYIGLWNLTALAKALEPLLDSQETQEVLDKYSSIYSKEYFSLMRAKMGFHTAQKSDPEMIDELLNLMHNSQVDYTIFFRKLSDLANNSVLLDQMFGCSNEWKTWLEKYTIRLTKEGISPHDRISKMNSVNPKFILRNYIAEEAIRSATYSENYEEIDKLLKLLSNPFAEQNEHEKYASPPPEWSKQICISCSS